MGTESLKSKAYHIIRERIANCTYPPASMLKEENLQTELSISRTPIRDALGRLEQERLIIIKPKKGILVSPLDINEINNIFEIRFIFEPYAIKNYGYQVQEKEYLSLYQKFYVAGEVEESVIQDDTLHKLILDAVPNHYIHQLYQIISVQIQRLRVLTGLSKERLETSNKEHMAILEACLKKDWLSASNLMREHLQKSKDSSFTLLLENHSFK
jgi:DNA-binding GntR family transcriptional regulator